MYRTEKLRGCAYVINRYVLRRADTLLWFWLVWTGAGRTTSRVGVILLPVRKRLPLAIGQIGICAQIRVPLPDVLSTSSVPPRRDARSRIERKPR